MDRISYLPQSILHHILSRLPDDDAAKTSVLSKAWHDTWSTFPFLEFHESRYQTTQIPHDANIREKTLTLLLNKYRFYLWVSRTMLSFPCRGLAIRKFKLVLKSLPPPDLLAHVNHWMKWACDYGVEVLQLDNGVEDPRSSDSYDEFACLPLCVLEAKSLIKLELSWNFSVDQAFLNHPIKFSSLQVLSLKHVYLGDGQVIQNLISNCPLIENLRLVRCSGLRSVSLHGLTKLKEVFIVGIEEVDIDAPSLEELLYDATGFKTISLPKINMDKCTHIWSLCFVCVSSIIITNQWFLELFQKFPILEELILEGFYMSDMINISSIQLNVFELLNCYDLEVIEIDAPNLFEFNYHGDGSILPSIYILNSPCLLALNVTFFVDFHLDIKSLRTFLEGIRPRPAPVSLYLGFCDDSTVEFNPFELQDYSMGPPNIKHMTLCADSHAEEWSLLLFNSSFWSCRPSIISFYLDENNTLVKIFCEKLLCRKEDGCCCSSSLIKCWWHFLKDVKVSSSFRNHNAPDDLKTLLEPFRTLSLEEEEEISRFMEGHINFWLEWQL